MSAVGPDVGVLLGAEVPGAEVVGGVEAGGGVWELGGAEAAPGLSIRNMSIS